MDSLWTATAQDVKFNRMAGDMKTDTLIIGGGIAGILTAYMLRRRGVDCVLLEADRICSGITKNTTAKITLQNGLIYEKIISRYGLESAERYLQAQIKASEKYRELCQKIDCDYEIRPSYVYSRTKSGRERLEKEARALERLGYPSSLCDELELPIKTTGAIRVDGQAQFHPLKFLYKIAEGLPIYENTKVFELRPGVAITERGRVKAENIIVATHFPFINKHGSYFLKMYQHRSYVIALEGARQLDGMYVDEDIKGLSFREAGELLLLGGGSHRTGKGGGGWSELRAFANAHYADAVEKYHWATQDCMTLDGIPYIGRYSSRTENLFVATGFNKWGMTSSLVSAIILSDLVRGVKNEWAEVFSPSRSILHPQLLVNGIESVLGLITPSVRRCPHLGCALKYNRAEHSWDCPCHGSRFAEDGSLIDNPATDDRRPLN